jgi:integrase
MKARGYPDFSIEIAGYDLRRVGVYLAGKGETAYSPALGKEFLSEWHLTDSGRTRHATLIRKLDDIYRDGEFKVAHRPPPTPPPEGLRHLLEIHLANCREAGNSQNTVSRADCACRSFLIRLAAEGCPRPEDIDGTAVYRAAANGCKSDWGRIRGMLEYLASEGVLEKNWSAYVPVERRPQRLPSVYSRAELESALAAVDRTKSVGQRDYAIMMLLTRYGMRVGDIVALAIGSVDFGNGRIEFVQEKTGNPLTLPLLPEVASALEAYIRGGRPDAGYDNLFLRAKAPHAPLTGPAVHHITTKYLKLGGVDIAGRKHGPHSMRSSLATAMVNGGGGYDLARRTLGHSDPDSIRHYARLDVETLRKCAVETPPPSGDFALMLGGTGALP